MQTDFYQGVTCRFALTLQVLPSLVTLKISSKQLGLIGISQTRSDKFREDLTRIDKIRQEFYEGVTYLFALTL